MNRQQKRTARQALVEMIPNLPGTLTETERSALLALMGEACSPTPVSELVAEAVQKAVAQAVPRPAPAAAKPSSHLAEIEPPDKPLHQMTMSERTAYMDEHAADAFWPAATRRRP